MGHPSQAPGHFPTDDLADDQDEVSTVRPLRLSRMPVEHANMTLKMVEEIFRDLRTEPPGPADNDELTEDELFAIWVARLC